jgi:hypothetical protein
VDPDTEDDAVNRYLKSTFEGEHREIERFFLVTPDGMYIAVSKRVSRFNHRDTGEEFSDSMKWSIETGASKPTWFDGAYAITETEFNRALYALRSFLAAFFGAMAIDEPKLENEILGVAAAAIDMRVTDQGIDDAGNWFVKMEDV